MKKTLSVVGVCALLLTGAASAETLRFATEGAYPPFNYVDADNKLHGFDIDITNALCAQMKVECTLVAQDWEGIIPALMARKYDAVVASMIDTEERRKKIAFTNHYYRTPLTVAVAKDSPIKDAQADFKGYTVGAQSSSTQAIYAEDVYAKAGADVKLYPTMDEANADLAAGRLDGVIADKFPLHEWMNKNGQECCKVLGDVNGTKADAAIAVRKDDDALRERLNKALAEIVANGTYQKIASKYFAFDIYN
ncbi:transporter substrate-binding domain-containing protein [Pseudomonas guariconensis]|uniref:transporter substrate-binding domain-containing protein n=1 Tax=Pseudomonas guariconensis TaxID=1288410 RepID=UPI0018D9AD68|nr:transporter substrate-binding domain-containing protein [Pseudomonas guariconensis]MBH3360576.1 transporter substrate-binding domain-containing protein [Pseudomonas guariconensis]MEB3842617.1 transporter substrate-binding domain-containing protein [Pseudomonas guariconensis]MEB3875485.1 transporter substrate-binding domain-containing protein [Pseudomonas guariconensis]MEB3877712.1 transporter substrate-binding domain-containing protein [Pseudomonas guariconensis]MEB3894162.1 transporter sub